MSIRVLVAGLPGKMATLIAHSIVEQDDMVLYPFGFSEDSDEIMFIGLTTRVQLLPKVEHDALLMRNREEFDLVVDFTQPKSVNCNAELYCRFGIPFVMGTTGGDRQELFTRVRESNISSVVATNMATPIVVFQEIINSAAANLRNSFEGFRLVIKESHQAQKPDPSGTAVSLLPAFEALGIPYTKEQIIMVRDPVVQEVEMGIPKEHLTGHGYHTYTLLSPNGDVFLQFTHNILGRQVYADGAIKAIRFLVKHLKEKGNFFSMLDVLKGV